MIAHTPGPWELWESSAFGEVHLAVQRPGPTGRAVCLEAHTRARYARKEREQLQEQNNCPCRIHDRVIQMHNHLGILSGISLSPGFWQPHQPQPGDSQHSHCAYT